MSELTDNDAKIIKIIVDETSDAVVRKLTSTIYRNNTDSLDCVLDKIRAEIEEGYCVVNNDYDHGRNYGLYMATQIIDKYKVESEENNGKDSN